MGIIGVTNAGSEADLSHQNLINTFLCVLFIVWCGGAAPINLTVFVCLTVITAIQVSGPKTIKAYNWGDQEAQRLGCQLQTFPHDLISPRPTVPSILVYLMYEITPHQVQ